MTPAVQAIAVASPITEAHVSIADEVIKRVQAMLGPQCVVKSYQVHDHGYETQETLKLQINERLTLSINIAALK